MKKIFSVCFFLLSVAISNAQDAAPNPRIPHIRSERKELKREHFANREMRLETRIHRDRRELRHMQGGRGHEWRRGSMRRPMGRPLPHRRPMMNHRRK